MPRRVVIDLTPLRASPAYRRLWSGQLLGQFARQSATLAVAYQAYSLTGSPLGIGAIALASLVPLLCFAIPAGGLADVVDRRRLMLLALAGQVLVGAGLVVNALPGTSSFGGLLVLAFLSATLTTVDRPARRASVARLVPDRLLAPAIVLDSSVVEVAKLVGPALAGVLIAQAGLPLVYAIQALLYVGALLVGLGLPAMPPMGDRRGLSVGALAEGLRFVVRTPMIVSSFGIDLVAMVFGLPVALFPIIAAEEYGGRPEVLGILAAAPALGAILGALGSGWVGHVQRQGRAVVVAVGVWGLSIIAFGLTYASLPLAVLCLAVAGASDVISTVFRGAILQWASPDAVRGRVSGVQALIFQGGPRLGDLEATAVAAALGVPFSILSGGVLCIVGTALIVARHPGYLAERVPATEAPPGIPAEAAPAPAQHP